LYEEIIIIENYSFLECITNSTLLCVYIEIFILQSNGSLAIRTILGHKFQHLNNSMTDFLILILCYYYVINNKISKCFDTLISFTSILRLVQRKYIIIIYFMIIYVNASNYIRKLCAA